MDWNDLVDMKWIIVGVSLATLGRTRALTILSDYRYTDQVSNFNIGKEA
jgi:hypothetical protein